MRNKKNLMFLIKVVFLKTMKTFLKKVRSFSFVFFLMIYPCLNVLANAAWHYEKTASELFISPYQPSKIEVLSLKRHSKHKAFLNKELNNHSRMSLSRNPTVVFDIENKISSSQETRSILPKCLQLLKEGSLSSNQKHVLASLFGAGLASSTSSIDVLKHGISHQDFEVQMATLYYLSRFQEEEVGTFVQQAMRSSYLPIRIQAALELSNKRYLNAAAQIESLMRKIPSGAKPLFPAMFAQIGDQESILILKQLLYDENISVRISAILSCAQYGREDFLEEIIRLSRQPHSSQQEACLYTLGVLEQPEAEKHITSFLSSQHWEVRLAALYALYRLGQHHYREEIVTMAEEGNLHAIVLLANILGCEDTLEKLIKSNDLNISLNATYAALHQSLPCIIYGLNSIFNQDLSNLEFTPVFSAGSSMLAWKAVPRKTVISKNKIITPDMSHIFREKILEMCGYLPPPDFIRVIQEIFNEENKDLIPMAVSLLQQYPDVSAENFLIEKRKDKGNSLLNTYATVALYRRTGLAIYQSEIIDWLKVEHKKENIDFKPIAPWKIEGGILEQEKLIPSDSCRLLIEAFEVATHNQNPEGIEVALDYLKTNTSNLRFAVCGILIRTLTQSPS